MVDQIGRREALEHPFRLKEYRLTIAKSSPGIGGGGGMKLSPSCSFAFFLNLPCSHKRDEMSCQHLPRSSSHIAHLCLI